MKKYRSLNNPDGFNYNDAELWNVSINEKNMIWTSSCLTVTPENPLSEYDHDVYTEDTTITFENYRIEKVIKHGFRVHSSDAVEDFPDIVLDEYETAAFLDEMKSYKK